MSQFKEKLPEIIDRLTERLGRSPTDDEVYNFIFGSEGERLKVWNAEVHDA